jgi:hypothetical protein
VYSRNATIDGGLADCIGFESSFIGATAADVVTSHHLVVGTGDQAQGVKVQDLGVEVEVYAVGVGLDEWSLEPGSPASRAGWTITEYGWGTVARAAFPSTPFGPGSGRGEEPGRLSLRFSAEGLKVQGGLVANIVHKVRTTMSTSDGRVFNQQLAGATVPGLQVGEVPDDYQTGVAPATLDLDVDPIAGLPFADGAFEAGTVFDGGPPAPAQLVAGPPVAPTGEQEYTVADDLRIAPPEEGEVIAVLGSPAESLTFEATDFALAHPSLGDDIDLGFSDPFGIG